MLMSSCMGNGLVSVRARNLGFQEIAEGRGLLASLKDPKNLALNRVTVF